MTNNERIGAGDALREENLAKLEEKLEIAVAAHYASGGMGLRRIHKRIVNGEATLRQFVEENLAKIDDMPDGELRSSLAEARNNFRAKIILSEGQRLGEPSDGEIEDKLRSSLERLRYFPDKEKDSETIGGIARTAISKAGLRQSPVEVMPLQSLQQGMSATRQEDTPVEEENEGLSKDAANSLTDRLKAQAPQDHPESQLGAGLTRGQAEEGKNAQDFNHPPRTAGGSRRIIQTGKESLIGGLLEERPEDGRRLREAPRFRFADGEPEAQLGRVAVMERPQIKAASNPDSLPRVDRSPSLELPSNNSGSGFSEGDDPLYQIKNEAPGTSPSNVVGLNLTTSYGASRNEVDFRIAEDGLAVPGTEVRMRPNWLEDTFGESALNGSLSFDQIKQLRTQFKIDPSASDEERAFKIKFLNLESGHYKKFVDQLFDPLLEERARLWAEYRKIITPSGLEFQLNEEGFLDEESLLRVRQELGINVDAHPEELGKTFARVAKELKASFLINRGTGWPTHPIFVQQLMDAGLNRRIDEAGKPNFYLVNCRAERDGRVNQNSETQKIEITSRSADLSITLDERGLASDSDIELLRKKLGIDVDARQAELTPKFFNVAADLGLDFLDRDGNPAQKAFLEQLMEGRLERANGSLFFRCKQEVERQEESERRRELEQKGDNERQAIEDHMLTKLRRASLENYGSLSMSKSKLANMILEDLESADLDIKIFRELDESKKREEVLSYLSDLPQKLEAFSVEETRSRFGRDKIEISFSDVLDNLQNNLVNLLAESIPKKSLHTYIGGKKTYMSDKDLADSLIELTSKVSSFKDLGSLSPKKQKKMLLEVFYDELHKNDAIHIKRSLIAPWRRAFKVSRGVNVYVNEYVD